MDPWGTPDLMVCSEEQVWLIWTHCWGQEKVRVRWSNSLTFSKEQLGRFPFDQKFLKFRVWEQMEQTFSGISFRNFRCTSQGWPKIPENSVPFDHSCSRPVSQSPEIELNMASNSSAQYQCSACYYATDDLNVLLHHFCTGATANFRKYCENAYKLRAMS